MNANSPSPADSPAEIRADPEFRAFFRRRLPAPFPPLALPEAAEPVRPPVRRSGLTRSRVVLAVCVTLLLGVMAALMNSSTGDRPGDANPDGISAKRVKDPLGRP